MQKMINILEQIHTLKETKGLSNVTGNMGMYFGTTKEIAVEKTVAKTVKDETVLHEVIHALSYQLSLELDERTVHALSAGLYAVMIANKKLILDMLK